MRAIEIFKAFLAGFAATLLFHQPVLWLLFRAGIAPRAPYSMAATKPFGVPSVVSLAFWGGIWGIILVLVLRRTLKKNTVWIAAAIFGAIAPTLVAAFVVAPLKGVPIPKGPNALITGLAVNAAWGIGTVVFLKLFR